MFVTKNISISSSLFSALLAVALLCCVFNVHAQGIEYSAKGLKIELSEDVQAAIDNGVSLTFECEFAHVKHFLLFSWPDQIKRHRFVVTRHALSNRYQVQYESRLAPRMFSSTRETMAFIAEQSQALFLKYHSIDEHNNETHEMRLRLSKTELPAPMRLNAFISRSWNLDSGWEEWQSAL